MRSIIDYRYDQLSKQGEQASARDGVSECNKEGVIHNMHTREMKVNKLRKGAVRVVLDDSESDPCSFSGSSSHRLHERR